ncbi:MAG: hypothetical protein H6753_05685 [Candidatus Omnitrophica bacterium]|nr:hypothetical protein [Candidatus Omnitrophota bacterium]
MKKLFLLTVLAVALSASAAFAAAFPITATIPAATTVNFIVSEVTPPATAGGNPVFASYPSLNLNFATAGQGMKYDTKNGIWTGDRFFAIDLAPVTAGGVPAPGTYGSISFSYAANVVPAGQAATEGLNKRATLTAVKVVGTTETQLRNGAMGNTFSSLSNADVAGGFLRVYVGLATGETTTGGAPVVPGSVPFTNADKPGTYTGTLTITATLV